MVAHNILTRSPLQRHPAFRYMCNHTFRYMCIVDCEILFSSTRAMFIQGRSLRSLPSVNLMTIAVKVQRQVHDNIYDHMWSSARCIWDLEAGMQHTVCRCLCRVCRRWSRVCSAGYDAAAAAAGAPDRGAPAGDKFGAEAPGGRLLLLVLPPLHNLDQQTFDFLDILENDFINLKQKHPTSFSLPYWCPWANFSFSS